MRFVTTVIGVVTYPPRVIVPDGHTRPGNPFLQIPVATMMDEEGKKQASEFFYVHWRYHTDQVIGSLRRGDVIMVTGTLSLKPFLKKKERTPSGERAPGVRIAINAMAVRKMKYSPTISTNNLVQEVPPTEEKAVKTDDDLI